MDQVTIIINEPAPQPVTISAQEIAEPVTININDPVGLPPGGSAGQVLSKINATNYNAEWTDPSSGSSVIGPNQVAFGAPVTGEITGNNNIQIFPDFGGNPARGYFQSYGARMGNINAGVVQVHTDSVVGWTNLELQPSGAGYIGFYTGGGNERARIDSTGVWKIYGGAVATDYALRIDSVGGRFGPLSTMSATNNYPFEVDGLFRVNQPMAGYGITLNNPPYGGHFLSIKFDTFNSIYQQYYGDTIFRSDSFSGGLGQLTLKQNGETEIKHVGNTVANFSAAPTFYNNVGASLHWLHNGGIHYLTFNGAGNPSAAYGMIYNGSYTGVIAPAASVIYLFIGPNAKVSVTNTDFYIDPKTTLGRGLQLAASVAGLASVNIPSGVAPSSPVSGDIWYNGTNLKFRNGSTTRNINTDEYVVNEVPAGLINGSNATFTTAFDFVPETVEVFLNGLKLTVVDDYNTSGNDTITFSVSPEVGDEILVNYSKT